MATTDLTAERLRELFHYNPDTGIFTRRVKTCNSIPIDSPVGSLNKKDGYLRVKIDFRSYSLHRLAWLYTYGSFPVEMVDHRNGIGTDNRIANLREVTRAGNLQNQRKAQRNSRSGLLGVYPNSGKWRAVISTNGVSKALGNFETKELAYEAYLAAKRVMHSTCTI